jgi:IstB-like ATP binding protein
MRAAAMLQAAHHDNTLAHAWVVRIVDQNLKALFLARISQARPASAKVGLPVRSATRLAATTARSSISVSPSSSPISRSPTATAAMARIMRSLNGIQLLILDDWGLEPVDSSARRDLYEILEERYGRRSTILTSQIPIDKWHEIIGNPTRLCENTRYGNLSGLIRGI